MENYLGEIAALATAACWSFGSVMFTMAGRRIGSYTVNLTRLWLALAMMTLMHLAAHGTFFPEDAGAMRFVWLGLSGFVGFVLGDGLLFEAFVRIGPRLSMLMMTLVPVFSGILGWAILGEYLLPMEWLAIVVTLAGIALVVGDGAKGGGLVRGRYAVVGILCGIGGALGQAGGLLLAKMGLIDDFSAVSANVIRITAATMAMGFIVTVRGHLPMQLRKLSSDGRAFLFIASASVLGPVVGVVLSLVSISYAPIGIASTLMSLSPVLLLPLSHWFFNEKITRRAVIGTFVAIIGASMFFWIS